MEAKDPKCLNLVRGVSASMVAQRVIADFGGAWRLGE